MRKNSEFQQLSLPFTENEFRLNSCDLKAKSLAFIELERAEIMQPSNRREKPQLLLEIEAANRENRRNVRAAMNVFAEKLTNLANGIPIKREPWGIREVNKADGTVRLISI